jgi:NAD(P)-dependent dehydrogenase (short-subunit alcohol dehydrogenase family)
MTDRRAQQRVAVVTGAASGVGFATAEALRDDGFIVVGVDLAEAPAGRCLVASAADIVVSPFLQT